MAIMPMVAPSTSPLAICCNRVVTLASIDGGGGLNPPPPSCHESRDPSEPVSSALELPGLHRRPVGALDLVDGEDRVGAVAELVELHLAGRTVGRVVGHGVEQRV